MIELGNLCGWQPRSRPPSLRGRRSHSHIRVANRYIGCSHCFSVGTRVADIRDIAKLAGVSVATVSRAFARPDVVKEVTKAKVHAAADRLGYKPNSLASGFRRQKTENIVVVVPYIQNPFFSGVVQGIENVAHRSGYKVLLGESQDQQIRLDNYAAMLEHKQADGLILLGAHLPTVVRERLSAARPKPVPLVMACEYFAALNAPNVRIDNVAAAALATDHLVGLGHRLIATITGPMDNPLSKDRLKGFKQRMKEARLEPLPELIAPGDFSAHSGYMAAKSLLTARRKPTAIFCANDEMAIGAINAAAEDGWRVPADISIVGFDDIRFSEHCNPPLTTIRQPVIQIGETAMQLMLELFSGNRGARRTVILPHSLVIRASTAARTK